MRLTARKIRDWVINPLLVGGAVAVGSAGLVELVSHPAAAPTLSALITFYIAVLTTLQAVEERAARRERELEARQNARSAQTGSDQT